MTNTKIIVVGGGPAGFMAAGQAALSGAQVTLLEKMKQTGRKLGISGKGRCNLTNSADLIDFIEHFGKNGRFLRQAFNVFFVNELKNFFQERGLELVTERGGRVFPKSGKASDVVHLLRRWLKDLDVEIIHSCRAQKLIVQDGKLTGVITSMGKMNADAVILATGGASYPATGSTGDGYKLALSVGHSIVTPRPFLIPLLVKENFMTHLSGLNLRNIMVRLYINNKLKRRDFGEVSFSGTSLTGPVILTISGEVVEHLNKGAKVRCSLDLKPALDDKKLEARLLRDFETRNKEPIKSVLRGLLPGELVPVCLKHTGILGDKEAGYISKKERNLLRRWLKDFQLTITGHRPLKDAIVTAGGVKLNEINPNTMESKKLSKLFITGELLDIHGDTGGFNLQAAFSTGLVAGQSATKKKS